MHTINIGGQGTCADQRKKYDAELLAEGITRDRIIHYGMAFCGKEAMVKIER